MRFTTLAIVVVFILVAGQIKGQDLKELRKSYKLIFSENFSDMSLDNFELTDSSQWIITKNGNPGKDMKCTSRPLHGESCFFPRQIAFVKGILPSTFMMEFDLMQKSRDFSVRDVCVVFGYHDENDYYFAQVAAVSDRYTHNIFQVTGSDRPQKIGKSNNAGIIWSYEKWHRMVLVRDTESQSVRLFVDDELILECDTNNGSVGKVGIGSVASDFKIDNLKVWVPETSSGSK